MPQGLRERICWRCCSRGVVALESCSSWVLLDIIDNRGQSTGLALYRALPIIACVEGVARAEAMSEDRLSRPASTAGQTRNMNKTPVN